MAAAAMSPPLEADMKVDVKVEDGAKSALTPPTSEGSNKKDDDSGSELSDLEPEETTETAEAAGTTAPEPKPEDDGEIRPDHYYEGGNVPVFKPVSRLANNMFRCVVEGFVLINSPNRPWINSEASKTSYRRSTNMA